MFKAHVCVYHVLCRAALQALLIPYLPSALEALLLIPQPDASDVIDVLQLLGQLITR
jgi:hypothetical protein